MTMVIVTDLDDFSGLFVIYGARVIVYAGVWGLFTLNNERLYALENYCSFFIFNRPFFFGNLANFFGVFGYEFDRYCRPSVLSGLVWPCQVFQGS